MMLLIALLLGQMDVRLRMAERDAKNAELVEAVEFPGYDMSDEAVTTAARHYCGTLPACSSSFLDARDELTRSAALQKRVKGALRLIKQASDERYPDWRYANTLYQATYNPPQASYRRSYRVTCRTYSSGKTAWSSCSGW
ncbi:hypothetical protein [Sphingomonas sp. Leaf343]|uniref:hypothetical protein n=1 Tax=Sphingomonas sp. Leaf343 TaxID=1736345 RepID=UPI0012E13004|nr:hypothetical protein [Sphingomonas sp. Leaf343]